MSFMRFTRQMDGTWKCHSEWGIPVIKKQTWYILTDKWILAKKKFRIPTIQLTDHMKPKKKEDHTKVWMQTVLLRRGKEIILGDRGREEGERKGGRRDGLTIRALAALPEHSGLLCGTHDSQLTPACDFNYRRSNSVFWSPWSLHSCTNTHTHTHTHTCTYTNK